MRALLNRGSAAIAFEPVPWAAVGALGLLVLGAIAAGVPWAQALVLLALAPWSEEVVFRAGLHEALLRRPLPPLAATGLTALCFALAHAAVQGLAAGALVALPALVLGLVYARTRRVLPCVLLHAAMNAVWLGQAALKVHNELP